MQTYLEKMRKALSTRRLFANWLSLLLKYTLNRVGFKVQLKVKVDKCYFDIDPEVFARVASRLSCIPVKSVRCINGKLIVNDIEVESLNNIISKEFWTKLTGWRYNEECQCWIKDDVKFKRIYYTILRSFGSYGKHEYGFLNVVDRVVVVGAYVDDSAIYFVLRGARRVIAIEPHLEAFKEMIDNIKLNNLENRVIPVNAGLASEPGNICIESVDAEKTAITYHKPGECETLVPAITLADVINQYEIGDDAI